MPSYRILQVVDATEVPGWERRPPKWEELVDKVKSLTPGQTLVLEFDDAKAADRARNAVRDTVNLDARAVVLRTRLVEEGDHVTLYLTKVQPAG